MNGALKVSGMVSLGVGRGKSGINKFFSSDCSGIQDSVSFTKISMIP